MEHTHKHTRYDRFEPSRNVAKRAENANNARIEREQRLGHCFREAGAGGSNPLTPTKSLNGLAVSPSPDIRRNIPATAPDVQDRGRFVQSVTVRP